MKNDEWKSAACALCSLNCAGGHVSLPNGIGLDRKLEITGASANELTWNPLADESVGTPWHKSVPACIEAID